MNRLLLSALFSISSLTQASSLDAIYSAENSLDLRNISVNDYANKISLSADAGWHKIKTDNGGERVYIGNGFIERFTYSTCVEYLTLIDKIKETNENKRKIESYCKLIEPNTPKTDLILKSLRSTLFKTADEQIIHISEYSSEGVFRLDFDFYLSPLTYDPIKEKGISFTKKVADCVAKETAVSVLNYKTVHKIQTEYGSNIMSRSLCIVDKNYGEKLMSSYIKKYIRKKTPN